MPYKLTRDVKVMSLGFDWRRGTVFSQGQVTPGILSAWLDEGVAVKVEDEAQLTGMSLEELRVMAKQAGIVNAHLMRADTLREKLARPEVANA